ncbi:uncharacterized protein LOC116778487 isoform X2 [Danaus plexippus]|uniref:uncharacterized protein LOC116778487 isoform X2 n=1 Tax=Danaus plexippus TaxID=13037 RepID=UPI002AAF5C34|nr:uncharacterized protein LOC116778487 isoform X2 [Danaus plexippus]
MNSGRFRNYLKQDKIKMRFFILLLFAICVSAKINPKALTESMGQEVIEIGAPIKELSPDLEEEPSAENEDDKTTTTIQVATTKETRRVKSDPSKRTKDSDRIDGKKQEDEEAKIEKELAELYRDSIDYKSESAEITQEVNATEQTEKPIARARTNFKFQPDSSDPKDVERFRTSVDDINCDRVKLTGGTEEPTSAGRRLIPKITLSLLLTAMYL